MLSTKQPDVRIQPLPNQVQIEPVGQCNLRCEMCLIRFRKEGPPYGPPAFMRESLFQNLVDQCSGARELHLQGLGEPLLHPAFFRMVAYAAKRGFRVSTNSNMTLLRGDRAEECVRSRLSWIRVSIDGATAETYESIRTGSRLERVLGNLDSLRRAKEKLGSTTPRLLLVMVVMKRNLSELKDVVRLACDSGMEEVFVQHLCYDLSEAAIPAEYRSLRDFVAAESLLDLNRRDVQSHFNEALSLAGKRRIALRLPHIGVQRQPPGKGSARCDWPRRSLYITHDGKVMPCCMIALPGRMTLGDVTRDSLRAVWNNEQFRAFRRELASADPPAVCRTCSVYRGSF